MREPSNCGGPARLGCLGCVQTFGHEPYDVMPPELSQREEPCHEQGWSVLLVEHFDIYGVANDTSLHGSRLGGKL